MVSPLFKKLVSDFTFGEVKKHEVVEEKVEHFVSNPPDNSNMYPVIRRGKIIGWEKF